LITSVLDVLSLRPLLQHTFIWVHTVGIDVLFPAWAEEREDGGAFSGWE